VIQSVNNVVASIGKQVAPSTPHVRSMTEIAADDLRPFLASMGATEVTALDDLLIRVDMPPREAAAAAQLLDMRPDSLGPKNLQLVIMGNGRSIVYPREAPSFLNPSSGPVSAKQAAEIIGRLPGVTFAHAGRVGNAWDNTEHVLTVLTADSTSAQTLSRALQGKPYLADNTIEPGKRLDPSKYHQYVVNIKSMVD